MNIHRAIKDHESYLVVCFTPGSVQALKYAVEDYAQCERWYGEDFQHNGLEIFYIVAHSLHLKEQPS